MLPVVNLGSCVLKDGSSKVGLLNIKFLKDYIEYVAGKKITSFSSSSFSSFYLYV